MRIALLALLAALPQAPAERAFVEITAPRAEVYAGEPVRIGVRVGVEKRFLAEGLVPSTLRPLELPVRVDCPWFDAPPGAAPLGPGPGEPAPASFALNDGVVAAAAATEVDREGRAFAVRAWERAFVFAEPGSVAIPAPVLRFSSALSWRTDALGGRVPDGRRDEEARGAPLTLRVLPLPAEGRPEGFRGAVGRYSVRAALREGDAGAEGSLRLDLAIEGEGNLPLLDAPGPAAVEGFHLLGTLDDRGAPVRTLTYDLRPLPGTRAVPPLAFPHFDPAPPAGWRTARTEPIPLAPGAATTAAAPPPGPAAPEEEGGDALVLALLAGAGLLAAAVAWTRRGARRAPAPPSRVEVLAAAAAAFRERMDRAGADAGVELSAFLAAFLECPPGAVLGPGLADRLRARGAPEPAAASAAALLDRLTSARYGGGPPPAGAAEEARAVVQSLAAPPR